MIWLIGEVLQCRLPSMTNQSLCPMGQGTPWVIHEYTPATPALSKSSIQSLCPMGQMGHHGSSMVPPSTASHPFVQCAHSQWSMVDTQCSQTVQSLSAVWSSGQVASPTPIYAPPPPPAFIPNFIRNCVVCTWAGLLYSCTQLHVC